MMAAAIATALNTTTVPNTAGSGDATIPTVPTIPTTPTVPDTAGSDATIPTTPVACLNAELTWFSQVLDVRFKLYFSQPTEFNHISQLPPPDLSGYDAAYAALVKQFQLDTAQRLVMMLALTPHIQPQLLDNFFIRNPDIERHYSEFGGLQGKNHNGFLPTCETAVFLLASTDLANRIAAIGLFARDSILFTQGIIELARQPDGEPYMSSALSISQHHLQLFTRGHSDKLDYASHFPAKLITTKVPWDHLVLTRQTRQEIDKLVLWGQHSDTIMAQWGLEKTLKPGYRVLFYGPPGTGKTLTATLLGQQIGSDVYRIDLSAVVSKYIGETEKNLENLFTQAQNKNWVLFFDEADALFGKRSSGSSSNDRHSNQEIAYLLQRIEDFPGMVVLATNLKANVDDAFARRFQSMIYFPLPDENQRLKLWQYSLNGRLQAEQQGSLNSIAKRFELSGGAITNVVRHAALCAVQRGRDYMVCADLEQGAMKELKKEGKMI
ncbi:MAG: hypothetical protein ACI8WB_001249 [Phenylobacterium sp.]|jgi:hypothetical protein